MRFSAAAALLTCFTLVKAAEITVLVGPNNTLNYSPQSVTAAKGDTIVFEFQSKNHTITQSTFADPCTALAQGVNSGFRPANATTKPVFRYNVTDASSPLWFYCAQTAHCPNGMVFAINPTADKTFAQFQSKAKGLTSPGASSSGHSASGSATATGTAPATTASSGALRIAGTALGSMAAAAVVFGLVL